MAIANPLVISINSVNKSLAKINNDNYGSEYYLREATQEFRCKIRHAKEARQKNGVQLDRHNVELTQTIYSTTPGVPDSVLQTYTVIRMAPGDDATKLAYLQAGLNGIIDATMVGNLVGWQN